MRNNLLERGRQRVKIRLGKIQQDPLSTLTTSQTGIRLKHLIMSEYHNCPEDDQHVEYIIQEHDVQTEQPTSGTGDKPFVRFDTHQLSDYHDERKKILP